MSPCFLHLINIHCSSDLKLIEVDTVARDEVLSRDYRNKDSIVVIRVIHSITIRKRGGHSSVCCNRNTM